MAARERAVQLAPAECHNVVEAVQRGHERDRKIRVVVYGGDGVVDGRHFRGSNSAFVWVDFAP